MPAIHQDQDTPSRRSPPNTCRSVASGTVNSLRFIGEAFAPITAGYLGQQYGATVPYLLGTLVVANGFIALLIRFGFGGLQFTESAHQTSH
ncbi:multidrug-efflux transporter [Natrialba asiatica DSM 12278]|uniref:Multidrug-efflux transporter n=1 Tax=Natrialba asiatica (strain ATCC 700177 / DSM 12278 / JCM 9576 / FERM P-10747 / NBRC 102637 / 172P1) TaxID=29540 RepID=M0B5D4_NATA1|nr:multidrug-efflux transporter [Natrialba asiatica DSM 12278]